MSSIRKFSATLAAAASLAWLAPSHAFAADKPFADVGKQAPLTMLVPATPWLPSFTKLVEQYEAQTGNVVKLDVNPFAGVLDKARNDVRSGGGTYGALFLDTQWTIEMYEGGFVAPFTDIDPAFTMPKEVLSYGDSGYWNAQKRWRTADGGKLMGFTVLGNVQVWYYRTDVLKAAGLAPPKTWEDVLASCPKIAKPPASYGAVLRAERGNGIRYDWMQWMVERGGSVAKDRCAASSVRATHGLPRSSPTWSASTSIRRRTQSCCRSTKRARSRRSTAPSQGCRSSPGAAATMTHDYKRHGTTTLFAALNVLDGTVIGRCMQRHRHEEFIRFLNAVERASRPAS